MFNLKYPRYKENKRKHMRMKADDAKKDPSRIPIFVGSQSKGSQSLLGKADSEKDIKTFFSLVFSLYRIKLNYDINYFRYLPTPSDTFRHLPVKKVKSVYNISYDDET